MCGSIIFLFQAYPFKLRLVKLIHNKHEAQLRRRFMKINLKALPYLVVNIIAFYLLPIFIIDTGSGMFILLIVTPLICFITSVVFGLRHSFIFLYSVIVALLFIPTMLIFYDSSASIYVIIYGMIALIGNFIGNLFSK